MLIGELTPNCVPVASEYAGTMEPLSVINHYELLESVSDLREAIAQLVARVEREGDPGVLRYRFFVSDVGTTAKGLIDYSGPDAWIGHHEIAMHWPEMQMLHRVATLKEATFLGPFTPAMERWLENSALDIRITKDFEFAAGFSRSVRH